MPAFLDLDCEARSPRYYIFKEKPMTQEDFNKLMDNWIAARDKLGESPWSENEGAFEKLTDEGIINGKAPRAFAATEGCLQGFWQSFSESMPPVRSPPTRIQGRHWQIWSAGQREDFFSAQAPFIS